MEIHLGKRSIKTENNPHGWQEPVSIDLSKPILICLTGSATIASSAANGMCKRMEAMIDSNATPGDTFNSYGIYYRGSTCEKSARIYFSALAQGENAEEYFSSCSENAKSSILSIKEFARNIVTNVFGKLMHDENGNILEKDETARNFRKVTFASYCYGSVIQNAINIEMHDYLLAQGLDLETILFIEEQVCEVQFAPISENTKTGHSVFNFISLGDYETSTKPIQQRIIDDYAAEDGVCGVKTSENGSTIYIKEFTTTTDDEHYGAFYMDFFENWQTEVDNKLKDEELVGGILPASAMIVLKTSVQNAIKNTQTGSFKPFNSKKIKERLSKILELANQHPQEVPHIIRSIYDEQLQSEKKEKNNNNENN